MDSQRASLECESRRSAPHPCLLPTRGRVQATGPTPRPQSQESLRLRGAFAAPTRDAEVDAVPAVQTSTPPIHPPRYPSQPHSAARHLSVFSQKVLAQFRCRVLARSGDRFPSRSRGSHPAQPELGPRPVPWNTHHARIPRQSHRDLGHNRVPRLLGSGRPCDRRVPGTHRVLATDSDPRVAAGASGRRRNPARPDARAMLTVHGRAAGDGRHPVDSCGGGADACRRRPR